MKNTFTLHQITPNKQEMFGITHSTTRLVRLAKARSGMREMRLRASVRACRLAWCRREPTGTSVRLLSSSHRWRSCWRPSKLSSGTEVMWLASRRLGDGRTDGDTNVLC